MANQELNLLGNTQAPDLEANNSSEELKKITALIQKSGVQGSYFPVGSTMKTDDSKAVKVSTGMYMEYIKLKNKAFVFVTIFDKSDTTYTIGERIADIDKHDTSFISRKEIKASPENTIANTGVTSIIAQHVAYMLEIFADDVIFKSVRSSDTNNTIDGIKRAIKLNYASKRSVSMEHLISLTVNKKAFTYTKNYNPTTIDNMNTQFVLKANVKANDDADNGENILWFDSNHKDDNVARALYSLSLVGREEMVDGKKIKKLVPYVRVTGANYVADNGNIDNSAVAISIAVRGIIALYQANPEALSADLAKVLSANGDAKAVMKAIDSKAKTMLDATDSIDLSGMIIAYTAKIGGSDSLPDATSLSQLIASKGTFAVPLSNTGDIADKLFNCVVNGKVGTDGEHRYVSNVVMQPLYDGIDVVLGSPTLLKLVNWATRPTTIGDRITAVSGMNISKGAEVIVAKYLGGNRVSTPKAGYAISYVFTKALVKELNTAIDGSVDGETGNLYHGNSGLTFERTTDIVSNDGLGIVRF